jgi:hypothetical protein
LHPDRFPGAEDLRDPLSTGRPKALSADTIRTYANTLRRLLGADRVPDAGRSGYSLEGATSDWRQFVDCRNAATAGASPAEQAKALASALALVRGRPYSDMPRSGYGWVATELLVSEAEADILAVAQRLAALAATAEDWALAGWAAQRGLLVDAISEELNIILLRSVTATGTADRLSQTWRDITRRYIAADEEPPARLTDTNAMLKQRF